MTAGCDQAPARGAAAVTVDTVAGVVHVRNPADVPRWRAQPFVRIGSLGDVSGEPKPDELGRVRALSVDRDGNIYVADGQLSEIRVFAPDGSFVRAIGREGEGPGEMGSAYGVAVIGDTLATLDPRNARINLFTLDGRDAGLVRWIALTGDAGSVRLRPAGPGAAWFRGISRGPDGGLSGWYGRLTSAGVTDTLSELDVDDAGPPSSILCRAEGVIRFWSIPFVARRLTVPGPDGLATAWSAEYRVTLLDMQGDTTRVIQRDVDRIPVTDAEWEADDDLLSFAEHVEQNGTAGCEPTRPERPALKPAIVRLHFDQEGRLVVEHHVEGGTAFDLFDREGRIRGSLTAPPHDPDTPPYFRDDRLYVVQRDGMDVPYVVGYRLVGSGRP